jgi:hypothetical protein
MLKTMGKFSQRIAEPRLSQTFASVVHANSHDDRRLSSMACKAPHKRLHNSDSGQAVPSGCAAPAFANIDVGLPE